MNIFTEKEIAAHLDTLSEWRYVNNSITKKYVFPTFSDALIFANHIGEHAEDVGHHPELCVGWGYCTITLTTHDCKGVSSKDITFAEEVERLYSM